MKYILIILFLIPVAVLGQSKTVKQSNSSWNTVILDYKINNKFYLKNEAHFRRTHFLDDWQQILIRPSIHYNLNKTVDFAVGYTFAKNYRDTHNFNENDIWQQIMLSHASGKSNFKHRFRLEQRFIEQFVQLSNASFSENGTDFKMRFRYRFTWGMPLFKVTDTKKINLTAFDEIWLNTGSGIVPESINQNWFYVGISYPIFKNASLGMGYLNDYAPVGVNSFRNNNILQTTLKYHL
ncbi:DUF2490 domain-containing protein [Polaribacter batillariae]|uniref:DUF2490 domain-containing protein n=1 Tax=Polaribacter batillariae TaxID=2808900 RepID=A0ABX7SW91_9FLAO|nr:DUF2490 domain-containing protein [Polaribacter batillariae]QTD37246.1 DUF2490 domain-containing protein [Polaribacter batillariae]